MTIIPGAFYQKRKDGFAISAPVIHDGQIIGVQEKIHPFDYEKSLIRAGTEARVFKTGCRFGIVICYDMVFPRVANLLARKGARVLFSPARIGAESNPGTFMSRCVPLRTESPFWLPMS